jgi:hypothetical protein
MESNDGKFSQQSITVTILIYLNGRNRNLFKLFKCLFDFFENDVFSEGHTTLFHFVVNEMQHNKE